MRHSSPQRASVDPIGAQPNDLYIKRQLNTSQQVRRQLPMHRVLIPLLVFCCTSCASSYSTLERARWHFTHHRSELDAITSRFVEQSTLRKIFLGAGSTLGLCVDQESGSGNETCTRTKDPKLVRLLDSTNVIAVFRTPHGVLLTLKDFISPDHQFEYAYLKALDDAFEPIRCPALPPESGFDTCDKHIDDSWYISIMRIHSVI